MADGFVFGGIDLMSAPFKIAGQDGRDLGTPQVQTTSTPSFYLDGEIVTGRRTGNRTIELKVWIVARDRIELAASERILALAVDQPQNTFIWTPAGGLPVAYDTFRGQMVRDYSEEVDQVDAGFYTLTLPAFPFARSTETVTIGTSATSESQLHSFNGSDSNVQLDAQVYTGCSLTFGDSYRLEGSGSLRAEIPAGQLGFVLSEKGTAHRDCTSHKYLQVTLAAAYQDGNQLDGWYGLTRLYVNRSTGTPGPGGNNYYQSASVAPVNEVQGNGLSHAFRVLTFDLDELEYVNAHTYYGAGPTRNDWGFSLEVRPGGYSKAMYCWVDDMRLVPSKIVGTSGADGVVRVDMPGSYRTEATVHIKTKNTGTTELGKCLVHRAGTYRPSYDPRLASPKLAQYMRGTFLVGFMAERNGGSITPGTISATIKQTGVNGQVVTKTVSRYYTAADITEANKTGFFPIRSISLPLFDIPDDNPSGVIEFDSSTFLSASGGGSWNPLVGTSGVPKPFLLDTDGEMLAFDADANSNAFIDAKPADLIGKVLVGTTTSKKDASGIEARGINLMHMEPGPNQLYVISLGGFSNTNGADLDVTAYPRHFSERPN